ncbi:MAG: shikimate kinase [Actinomycetota bacterium]|nr:shikimate kinase [Actinomycetota bacterium]
MLFDDDPILRRAFELAWDSFRAGDPGVGAVVADDRGEVLTEGRASVGARLAHAELEALQRLPGALDGSRLTTTLEPCPMCRAAAVLSEVSELRFAGADARWDGVELVVEHNDHVRDRWPAERALGGEAAVLGSLLPLFRARWPRTDHGTIAAHRRAAPALVALSEDPEVVAVLDDAAAIDLDEAVARLAPRLTDAVAFRVPRVRHLVVMGLMSTGKTTVGVQVAAELGLAFVDNDAQLAARFDATAKEIEAAHGQDELHRREALALLSALERDERTVIAAAGWVIEDPTVRDALTNHDVVWLDATPAELAARIDEGEHRPRRGRSPLEMLRDQHDRRAPWFRRAASLRVDTGASSSPAEDVTRVVGWARG